MGKPTSDAEEEKETFWEQMDQELSTTLDEERVIVRGDLNGHIGRSREGIERIHGGWGMGDRNDEGEGIVETAMAFDLAIVNTFFREESEPVCNIHQWRNGKSDRLLDVYEMPPERSDKL